jgi:NADH-quinone oxidoreductase subunit C
METKDQVREYLRANFADVIIGEDTFRGQEFYQIKPEALFSICQALLENSELDIKFLSDITSVDWYGHAEEKLGRFEVFYNLYSLTSHYRFFLKVRLSAENPEVASLTPLWQSANWLEREVWDLMGIVFEGHPDLSKILTADELEGHPLRRDFPLTWEQPAFSWNQDLPPEVIK